MEREKTKSKT